MLDVATVTAIVVICYVFGMLFKALKKFPDELIPTCVAVIGGALGILGFYVIPGYPANNVMDAVAVGISSGLASVGVNQLFKQYDALTKQ